ncbi:hypothetical protein [Kribbella shirazensis]|uniref:DUF3592 domain-containing protein n=1 Tax=Kribbella shirazensis TaxID=1105143 RepID=A0A7X5VEU3_9ACTN|nr:hypothetical protein [Kribbella shirazensis]NIK59227.1 hypothetical protein [Kribbella shirazensis]
MTDRLDGIVVPTGRHRDGGTDGPWLERVILSTPVGEWSIPRLVLILLWIAGMAGISASFVYDDLMLDRRGELVTAVVLRTNYDQRDPSFNAQLHAPFAGARVLVEDIHQRPATGDLIDLEVDARKPTRVRDPQSWRWNPAEVAFIALAPTGALIAWARLNHLRRRYRR